MKFNEEEFLKTELGSAMKECIDNWETYLSSGYRDGVELGGGRCLEYKLAIKQFYGIEYRFIRENEYYGLVTETGDWVYKVKTFREMYCIPETTILRWIHTKNFPAYKQGHKWYIDVKAYEKWRETEHINSYKYA